jgi:hypothetical protein
MQGALSWLFRWSCLAATRVFCFALAAQVGPARNTFFLTYISIPLSPSPSKLGRQTCWVACLLLCVSGLLFNPVSHGSLEAGEGRIFRWFTVPSDLKRRTDGIQEEVEFMTTQFC